MNILDELKTLRQRLCEQLAGLDRAIAAFVDAPTAAPAAAEEPKKRKAPADRLCGAQNAPRERGADLPPGDRNIAPAVSEFVAHTSGPFGVGEIAKAIDASREKERGFINAIRIKLYRLVATGQIQKITPGEDGLVRYQKTGKQAVNGKASPREEQYQAFRQSLNLETTKK